jgi:DNA-binding HxlR family transcriptional regulator
MIMATANDIPGARSLLLRDTFEEGCPTRSILHQVTNRWSALILAALTDEPHRFAALHTRIEGISQKMLSQNLKALVRAGLVDRSVKATVPPQVTYSLTALGTDMTVPLLMLMQWIGEHTHELIAAQRHHDAQHTLDETAAPKA